MFSRLVGAIRGSRVADGGDGRGVVNCLDIIRGDSAPRARLRRGRRIGRGHCSREQSRCVRRKFFLLFFFTLSFRSLAQSRGRISQRVRHCWYQERTLRIIRDESITFGGGGEQQQQQQQQRPLRPSPSSTIDHDGLDAGRSIFRVARTLASSPNCSDCHRCGSIVLWLGSACRFCASTEQDEQATAATKRKRHRRGRPRRRRRRRPRAELQQWRGRRRGRRRRGSARAAAIGERQEQQQQQQQQQQQRRVPGHGRRSHLPRR